MPDEPRFWDALKKLQDRIVVIVPLVTLAVSVVTSMRDKARPPVLTLAIFTAFVAIYCVWIVFARDGMDGDDSASPGTDRKHRRRVTLLTIVGAALVVSGAWSFIYREHITYSRLAATLASGPQIAVTDDIAWQVLAYPTPSGEEHHTVAGELAALLKGLPYHVVVVPGRDFKTVAANPRVRAIMSGVAEESGLVIKAAVTADQQRILTMVEDSERQAAGS
jgi:hypothetical protein